MIIIKQGHSITSKQTDPNTTSQNPMLQCIRATLLQSRQSPKGLLLAPYQKLC
jgi:hypothetical protein